MTKTLNTPKLNVGIYARVSTDKQDNANQLDQLREFAARAGLGDRRGIYRYSHGLWQKDSPPV
jgi:DNA invertase Pin-like site-specific DNA recombinase